MGATIPAGAGAQYAAELRILQVYLSESLGRLGQNWGPLGVTFFIGGPRAPVLAPRRTAPGVSDLDRVSSWVKTLDPVSTLQRFLAPSTAS